MRNILLILSCFLLVISCKEAHAEKVWFSPNKSDFISDLYKNKLWPSSARHLNAYKYYCDTILNMNQDKLRQQVAQLGKDKIKIAIECAPLYFGGIKVEGFGEKNKILNTLKKVSSVGGQVSLIAMDEPLFFAHYNDTGKTYIGWSVEEICENMTSSLSEVLRIYPEIKIGDIEPIAKIKDDDLARLLTCYEEKMGRKLDFFHADVAWQDPASIDTSKHYQRLLASRQVRYGIIFNSSNYNADDNGWIESSRVNFDKYIAAGGTMDDVIFQSWNRSPRFIAPRAGGKSHSDMINYACAKIKCEK